MKLDRATLVAAILVFGTLSLLLVLPLSEYVLLAILIGYVLYPLQRRLAPRIGPRRSAGALVAAIALTVLLPLAALLVVATRQALSVLDAIREGRLGIDTVEGFLDEQVSIGIDLREVLGSGGLDLNGLLETIQGQGGTALFGGLVDLFGGLSNVVIGLTVLAFLSYYLLVDGPAFLVWLRGVAPISTAVWDELATRVDRLLWAVLIGNLAVATVQGVLTGVGLAVVGFPSVIFLTVATIVLGLLPLIGASIVWVPAAGYLLLVDRPVAALILFVYGATLVSISDNYLRPIIGGREAGLNPGLFVLGISGGLFVFGFLGVFFGPVVLGTLKVLIELFARDRTASESDFQFGGERDANADSTAGIRSATTAEDAPNQ